MNPFALTVFAFLGSMIAALCGSAALFMRPFRHLRGSGRSWALIGAGLNLLAWPVFLYAAPGTNNPSGIYIRAAALTAPCLLALLVYPWFQPRQGRGFEVMQPPQPGSDETRD
jgi:hypothetical protein